MKVNVFNRQRRLPVDRLALREFLVRACRRLEADQGVSVVLTNDRTMTDFNQRFRSRDKATDVLSFPNDSSLPEEESYLGDIIISVETADRQKRSDLLEELKTLVLHGLLHLMGYDHETDTGEMRTLEVQLRKEFQIS